MTVDRHRLRGAYARLKAMQHTITAHGCPYTLGTDYDQVVGEVQAILGEPMDAFKLPPSTFRSLILSRCY